MRIFLFLYILFITLHCSAQAVDSHWIGCPQPDDSTQIWFRHTFTEHPLPVSMVIAVASTGRFQLFVNERTVSPQLLMGDRPAPDGTVGEYVFDVSRYLQPDSNTVALWYSPTFATPQQVSIVCYGRLANGTTYAWPADGSWLYRPAMATNHGDSIEHIDNSSPIQGWNSHSPAVGTWFPVHTVTPSAMPPIAIRRLHYTAYRPLRIIEPMSIAPTPKGLIAHFAHSFYGWVRITLRDARPGEQLHIDHLHYVCNGQMDEQACQRFTIGWHGNVRIEGDSCFRSEQIQSIEGIEIAPVPHQSWQY